MIESQGIDEIGIVEALNAFMSNIGSLGGRVRKQLATDLNEAIGLSEDTGTIGYDGKIGKYFLYEVDKGSKWESH